MTGSYELRDLDHATVGQLYEGKLVIDKTYGHAAYGCSECCGYLGVKLAPNPFSGPPGYDFGDIITATASCGGYLVDVTDSGYNWASNNTAVATLTSATLHTVAVGSATGSSAIQLESSHPEPSGNCLTRNYNLQQPVQVQACDFSIAPANILAANCTGASQNSNNFNTTITPAGNSCLADQTKSTCSEGITHGSPIDFVLGSPKCVFNLGNPSAKVTYFAGPALPDGTAGTIQMTFNLVFNETSVSHTDNATVECPNR